MFNLEDFKKYGKAVRRDGQLARFIAHVPDALLEHERLVCMDAQARLFPCCEDGKASSRDLENKFDLVEVVRPMRRISLSMPEPARAVPTPGDTVHVLVGEIWKLKVFEIIWGANDPKTERAIFDAGCVWKTLEDAEAAVAAIKKGFSR